MGYWEGKLWRKQFDSLFIAMNENSDILACQFTEGTSLDKVELLLQGLTETGWFANRCCGRQLLHCSQETTGSIWREYCCQTGHFSCNSANCDKNTKAVWKQDTEELEKGLT